MANKRSPNLDAKINRLTRLVEKGFAAVAGDITHIKHRMATKDEVRQIVRAEIGELVPGIVALELRPIREQLKEIEHREVTREIIEAEPPPNANLIATQRIPQITSTPNV